MAQKQEESKKKLKEIFEQAARELSYEKKKVSLDWKTGSLKVKAILEPTCGRDNEYFLAPKSRS